MELRTRLILLAIFVVSSSSLCLACNVPVFRYALDHWRPDSYRIAIVHRGQLSGPFQSIVQLLKAEVEGERLNVVWKQVDVETLGDAELPEAVAKLKETDQPFLMVHYPPDLQIIEPVVLMPLDGSKLKELIDSPIRRELRKRLADGHSAVYILVASGNEIADQAARTTLESEIRSLQATLELPKLTDDPEDKIQGGPPLRVEFSVIELANGDEAEWALRNVLLGSEPDLKELNEPLVFPVFGRGRALWPLVGAGINADNLRESSTFVTGACSCQVKEQNPGFDLLMNVDWRQALPWATEVPVDQSSGTSTEVAETIPIPSGSNVSKDLLAIEAHSLPTAGADTSTPLQPAIKSTNTLVAITLAAVGIVAVATYLLSRQKRVVA